MEQTVLMTKQSKAICGLRQSKYLYWSIHGLCTGDFNQVFSGVLLRLLLRMQTDRLLRHLSYNWENIALNWQSKITKPCLLKAWSQSVSETVRFLYYHPLILILICLLKIWGFLDENHPPKADAGGDKSSLELPLDMLVLDGSKSSDDHGIVSYQWTRNDKSLAAGVSTAN